MDTMPASPVASEAGFTVSARAASQIAAIVSAQPGSAGPDSQALRVSVLAGGCSGFQYDFRLDAEQAADDVLVPAGPARVLVDPVSLDFLRGAELDYSDALIGAHFTVRNPNAVSSCGCGTSFAVD
ncbi:MAG: iron-sulfur cluster assembly accessory protein [Gluconacetobacter diazotrophicus]|nr:iron-sulfur cluster assembly accessory protein [Gluconacetobacter diazotrophicus]